VGFLAGWAVALDYVLTAAISALFVPHYLAVFGAPGLKQAPADGIVGIGLLAGLVALNLAGVRDSARLHLGIAVGDLVTQGLVIGVGLVSVLSLPTLWHNVRLGVAPTWDQLLFSLPIAVVAYTGIETISNLAGETRATARATPRATGWLIVTALT